MDSLKPKNYECVAAAAPATKSSAGSRDSDTFTDNKVKGNIASFVSAPFISRAKDSSYCGYHLLGTCRGDACI
jgi:hypothetical protein